MERIFEPYLYHYLLLRTNSFLEFLNRNKAVKNKLRQITAWRISLQASRPVYFNFLHFAKNIIKVCSIFCASPPLMKVFSEVMTL